MVSLAAMLMFLLHRTRNSEGQDMMRAMQLSFCASQISSQGRCYRDITGNLLINCALLLHVDTVKKFPDIFMLDQA